jgi:hypothetical protein
MECSRVVTGKNNVTLAILGSKRTRRLFRINGLSDITPSVFFAESIRRYSTTFSVVLILYRDFY